MKQSKRAKRYDRRMEDLEMHYSQKVECLAIDFWIEMGKIAKWKRKEATRFWLDFQADEMEYQSKQPKLIKVDHGMVLFA